MGQMIALALAASTLAYTFSQPLTYRMEAKFDGFLPIFGGNEGKVDVTLTVRVTPQKHEKAGEQKVESEIIDAKILFNDAPLPLGVDSVTSYFPKTQVTLSAAGKTLATTAPDLSPPVRLPGLDIQRFADLVYVPIEFLTTAVEKGANWKYERQFNGQPLTTEATIEDLSETEAVIAVKVNQKTQDYEDEGLAPMKSAEGATSEVTTELTGSGKATFDRSLGVFRTTQVDLTAAGSAKDLKSGEVTQRKLKIGFRVVLVAPEKKRAPGG